jgi:hypothetical protein
MKLSSSNVHYADSLGAAAYDRHEGQEFAVSELVTGSQAEVFDLWIRHVWLAGGEQVRQGEGRGHVGSLRRVPLGVEEEILSVGLPEEDHDASARIPSICYRVRKPGPFPLQSHRAMVHFVDAALAPPDGVKPTGNPRATLVVWAVKTEMSTTCNRLHCGGAIRLIFRMALRTFLRSLARSAASN